MNAYTIIAAALFTVMPTLGLAQSPAPISQSTRTMSPELRKALHTRAEAQREASLKLAELQAAQLQTVAARIQKPEIVRLPRMSVAELRASCALLPSTSWYAELLRTPAENVDSAAKSLAGSAGGRAAANLIK